MRLRTLLTVLAVLLPATVEAQGRCFYVRAFSNYGPFSNNGGGVVWVSNAQCVDRTLSPNDADVNRDFSDLLSRELGTDFVSGRLSVGIFVSVAGSLSESERDRQAFIDGLRGPEVREVGYAYLATDSGQPFFPGTPATQVCFYAQVQNAWTDQATRQLVKRAYVSNVQCSDRTVFTSTIMLQFDPWFRQQDPQMSTGSSAAWVYTTPNRAERERAEKAGALARDGYQVRTASFRLDDSGLPALPPLLRGASDAGTRTSSSGGGSSRQRIYRVDPLHCYAVIWTSESTGFVIPPTCYNGTAAPSEAGLRAQLSDWARLGDYGWVIESIGTRPMQLFRTVDQSRSVVSAAYDSAYARLNGPSQVYTPTGFNYNPYIIRRNADAQRVAAMQQDEDIVNFVEWLFSPFDWMEVSAEIGAVDFENTMTGVAGIRFRPYFDRTRIHLYANIDRDGAVPTINGERLNNWTAIRGGEFLLGFAKNHSWLSLGAAQLDYTVRTGNGLFWDETPGGRMTEITAGWHFDVNSMFGAWLRYGTQTQFAMGARLGLGESGIRRW